MVSHALLSSALLMASSAWAAAPQNGLLPGYLDPKTGTFTTQAAAQRAQGVIPDATIYNGTLTLKINITLKSGFPTDSTILCTQNASVFDLAGSYTASKTTRAARTGSTATCTVSIYYSWLLSSGDQEISQSYFVSIINNGTGSLYMADAATLSGSVEMPANNGTVTKTVGVTL
ncbi:MAG TPA: hypothetical protein VGQ91_09385 [Ideonella sp.]|jgi:hypothetical protein|nr:hypothetical protein [Ideonella sp.]